MKRLGIVIAVNLLAILAIFLLVEIGARMLGHTPIRGWNPEGHAYCDHYLAQYAEPYPAHRELFRPDEVGLPVIQRRNTYSHQIFDKKKPTDILLIGDSFTYGNNARPGTKSFAYLIQKRYNTKNQGIPGIDTGRYRVIAEKYVPIYKPKIVIVAFYAGNDLRRYFDHILPYTTLYWTARHPWVVNYDDWGRPFKSAERALEYVIARDCDKQVSGSLFRRAQLQSVIYKIYLDAFYKRNIRPDAEALRTIKANIRRIQTVAREHGAKMYIAIVPVRPEWRQYKWSNMEFARGVLKEFKHIKIDESALDKTKYGVGDKVDGNLHFNNAGHQVFAQQILDFIEKKKLLGD